MAVLTRCEPDWRFYSSPLSPRLAINAQINSIQPLRKLYYRRVRMLLQNIPFPLVYHLIVD